MNTILVPVDFSTVTKAVVAQAARMAHAEQSRIVLLHVTQPPAVSSEYAPYLESVGEIVVLSQKSAHQHLRRLAAELRYDEIPTEFLNPVGVPAPTILAKARALHASYIVLGSHGHTAFYELLVGSTAHSVLHRATCPVVVVPTPHKHRHRHAPATSPTAETGLRHLALF
ncbi:MAG: universal stress protein [Verrucomicrobia bacterium]|nr:universal stress protein [Verrucomicrobiota bacterium]